MGTETPYVLLVHGTWTNAPGWHSRTASPNFCGALTTELGRYGLSDAVWRAGSDAASEFNWTGSNSHEDRVEAGDSLGQRLMQIARDDPSARINIVAHSHGCNVTLRAVQVYLKNIQEETWSLIRRFVGEAGPNLDYDGAIERVLRRRQSPDHDHIREMLTDLKSKLVGRNAIWHDNDMIFVGPNEVPRSYGFLRSRIGTEFVRIWTEKRNRLGRVVFLGPPFLRKIWAPRNALAHFVVRAADFLFAFTTTVFAFYFFCYLIWDLVWLISAPIVWLFGFISFRFPTLNPLEWSNWLLIPASLICVMAASGIGAAASSASRRIDRNLYFDEESLQPEFLNHRTRVSLRQPIDTLVVSAELLDEVLLGFSCEPLVYGALLPQIKDFFNPKISFALPPTPVGYEGGPSEGLWRLLLVGLRVVTAVGWLALRPMTIFWERAWIRRLMQLISASAYGVQLHELDRAIIVASSRLGKPKFFSEKLWDVTNLIVAADAARERSIRAEQYSFLWDVIQFQSKQNSSWIWKSIEPHRKEIERHYSRFPQSRSMYSEDQMVRACIMLEERFSEAVGAVGLMHTAYHSNEVVIQAVARFIATGETPAQANA